MQCGDVHLLMCVSWGDSINSFFSSSSSGIIGNTSAAIGKSVATTSWMIFSLLFLQHQH